MIFCRYQPINKLTLTNLSLQKNWVADPLTFNDPMEFRLMDEYGAINTKIEGVNATQSLDKRNHLNEIIRNFGVVCYSLTYGNNNLMWSHYADSHNGMCLLFDVPKVNGFIPGIHEVNYAKSFELPDVNLNYSGNSIKEEIQKIVTTKSDDWYYEKEYRQIFYSKNEHVEYPGQLTEMIFGCQTSKNEIELVINIIKNEYKKIRISKSYIDRRSYNLGRSSFDLEPNKKCRIPDFWDGKCIK